MSTWELRPGPLESAPNTAKASRAKEGLHIHLDHYGGKRLPFACLSAAGLHQQLMRLDGESAGTALRVLDASGGYASACLGAAHPVVSRAAINSLETDGYVTDELGSAARSDIKELQAMTIAPFRKRRGAS